MQEGDEIRVEAIRGGLQPERVNAARQVAHPVPNLRVGIQEGRAFEFFALRFQFARFRKGVLLESVPVRGEAIRRVAILLESEIELLAHFEFCGARAKQQRVAGGLSLRVAVKG